MRILSAAAILFLSACCFPYRGYEGDGTFHDSCLGSWHGRSRYQVDFGPLDLSKTSRHTYRFAKLPSADMWIIGFEVEPQPNRPPGEKLDDAEISLLVTNERGQVVVSETRPISRWQWQLSSLNDEGVGPSFVYLAGSSRDIPIDNKGDVRVEPVGTKADGGWGTYIKPRRDGSYTLTVTVDKADPSARYFVIRPVVEGSHYPLLL